MKRIFLSGLPSFIALHLFAQWDFQSNYLRIHIDRKGWITSMKNIAGLPYREFSPTDKPSPLMLLYDGNKGQYYQPVKASYQKAGNLVTLRFTNGSVAQIRLQPQAKYIKLTLLSLSNRENIEDVQWGPYYTNITNLLGEIIG
ncbi:MAG: hypothetical protein IT250_17450, partial [Chitinophagaceae bacterium]|nr:hypothetical protein [Chitinophagaceae bacterium]